MRMAGRSIPFMTMIAGGVPGLRANHDAALTAAVQAKGGAGDGGGGDRTGRCRLIYLNQPFRIDFIILPQFGIPSKGGFSFCIASRRPISIAPYHGRTAVFHDCLFL
jgi:hypothetical protein